MKYTCKYCGYTQDFEPTAANLNNIFGNNNFEDNQCPSFSCLKKDAMEEN